MATAWEPQEMEEAGRTRPRAFDDTDFRLCPLEQGENAPLVFKPPSLQ